MATQREREVGSRTASAAETAEQTTDRPLLRAGVVLGVGLGGLVDVLVFHLILRTHHLISGWVPPTTPQALQLNLLADGAFSMLMLAIMAVGFGMLWKTADRPDVPWSAGLYAGAVVVGMALFNIYDGTVDHYLLEMHHVTQGLQPDAFDVLWLVGSVVLLVAGLLVVRAERREDGTPPMEGT
ncbi:hypothetical protein AUR64_06300 [Haloprofundus marisrubri]|uniref:DUF2243 domain-containing protein n=1 Tax=Haloprofundus marisrubri TaxID=1514971 RepID=A0A0W1RCE1_9EURY|nr:DUF2243 domain-containing protein [Haloprofundus marisrubri]KTG10799.1 hypothetical protein AUR64_06300 [Haloprofundus marisrubri]